jgi:CrcB protein
LNRFLLIAAGAALGANARYLVNMWAVGRFGADFPYGTLLVNISGSFILGFLLTFSTDRFSLSPDMRLLIAVGFLGSYTTFSSYAVESLNLWRENGIWLALRNVFLNNGIGLVFALLGTFTARWLG